MNSFTPAETAACSTLIEFALQEDLGPARSPDADITTTAFIDPIAQGRVALVARQPGVIAGLPAAAMVFAHIDSALTFSALRKDGNAVQPGERIATISGLMSSILTAERTALNFLQQLSGIATCTQQYVQAVAGLPSMIFDTRKTLPGWRLLAKYAVRQGGGRNHRMGLYDMFLIKDNHLAARGGVQRIGETIASLREHHPRVPIEIEVDTLTQLAEVLLAGPDVVLLDNMPAEQMREAVARRNAVAPQVLLEASGGVTLETVRAMAETGVDRISVGALTHSAPALDIGLDYELT